MEAFIGSERGIQMKETKKKLMKCLVCGAVFEEGAKVCPVCGVGPEKFEEAAEEKAYRRDTKERFLIIGGGAAGLSAAEAIRKRNATASVVMAGDEEITAYSRPMLTKSMRGENNREQLLIHGKEWYEENKIVALTGKRAVSIDPKRKEVAFHDGDVLEYDKLIYALGSDCFVPPIKGRDKPQVISIRRIADTEKVCSLLPHTKEAVVIGGGVLGLEAAWELKKAGLKVSVLELAPQLMGRQLDEGAGSFLQKLISEQGIEIHLNVKIDGIEGEEDVTGVRLGDGLVIPAQLVILSAGVRANVEPFVQAGGETGRAIKVNRHMETNLPCVYACGDCAEYQGINYAIWPQAVEMGKTAGANAAGEALFYHTVPAALTFQGMETSLFAAGDVGKEPDKQYTVEHQEDPDKKIYKTCYYKDGGLSGAILIGDTKEMQRITEELL